MSDKPKIFVPNLDGLRFFSFLIVFLSHIFNTDKDYIKNESWYEFFKGRLFADGDLARNDVNPRTGQPQQLGFDPFVRYTFANNELLMNAIAYLVQQDGLIAARNKEVKIRPLDKEKVRNEKLKWQIINIVLPLVLLIIYGVVRSVLRKRKFSSFTHAA